MRIRQKIKEIKAYAGIKETGIGRGISMFCFS
jgi:hypothetical protein